MPLIRLTLIVLCLMLAGQAGAAENMAAASVTVQGTAELAKAPDRVTITIGVRTQAAMARQAAEQNAASMNQVLAALKSRLGAQDKLQTSGYSLQAQYKWDPKNKQNTFMGFEAANQVLITSANLAGLGELLDASTKAGANNIQGISFELSTLREARRHAQAMAYADARAQAEALAREAGRALGKVLRISTVGDTGRYPENIAMMRKTGGGAPIEPGQISISAAVYCVFELKD